MSPDLSAVLGRDYMDLFQWEEPEIDCDDGWERIIRQACAGLDRINQSYGLLVVIPSIVRRDGLLQIYVEDRDPEHPRAVGMEAWAKVLAVVDRARDVSAATCETCGALGSLRRPAGHRPRVACHDHLVLPAWIDDREGLPSDD